MLACAGGLALVSATGVASPGAILALTFALGAGQAVQLPCWQAVQPELVDREEIPQASALAGISMNIARAVGPALGGVAVALAGPSMCFALNAVSFAVVTTVTWRWRRHTPERPLGAEHMGSAIRAGLRYVRSSPRIRAVLARGAIFVSCASAVWALLPSLARDRLDLGASGYGLLLGLVGLGAVLGAFGLPRLRRRFTTNQIVTTSSLTAAVATTVIGLSSSVLPVGAALLLSGASWIGVLASLNASAQLALPGWVRARGMSVYLTTFFGGQAIGGLLWGVVAQHTGLGPAMLIVAATLAIGSLATFVFPLAQSSGVDLSPADEDLPAPELALDREPAHGPVLVTVEYMVAAENHEAFREALARRGRARRRSGAERWSLYQDAVDPDRFVETFVVPTWEEHLRQHTERHTALDVRQRDEAMALVKEGTEPVIEHLLYAYDSR
jgi:predicted MFS family arabinose efflux permease